MKLNAHIELNGYGTSEGVKKAWESRGRGDAWKEFRNYKPTKEDKDADSKDNSELLNPITRFTADAAGGQTDTSSFIGRKYYVLDRYGHATGEYDNPDEAEHAAQAKPWSRVVSRQKATQTQELRDIARQRLVKTNPDVD